MQQADPHDALISEVTSMRPDGTAYHHLPVTDSCPVQQLQPGDVYWWGGTVGETREVLGIVSRGAMGAVLLEVRRENGGITRSYLNGIVRRINFQ